MKIRKSVLKKIIKEETHKILEGCNVCEEEMAIVGSHINAPVEATVSDPLAESESTELNVLVEMELASKALEQVVESVQAAAQLCQSCDSPVAQQAPIVDAMASQAEVLQEMLSAQTELVKEYVTKTEINYTGDLTDISQDEAFGLGYEAGHQGL